MTTNSFGWIRGGNRPPRGEVTEHGGKRDDETNDGAHAGHPGKPDELVTATRRVTDASTLAVTPHPGLTAHAREAFLDANRGYFRCPRFASTSSW
jgi:hypothetical protein